MTLRMLIGCLFLLPLAVGCQTTAAAMLCPEVCEYSGEWSSSYSSGNKGSLHWSLRSVGSDRFEGHALIGNSMTGSSDTPRTLTITRSTQSGVWRFSISADTRPITGTLSVLSADRIIGEDDRRTSMELVRVGGK